MRYRIDLTINPGKSIEIFRQNLTNNSQTEPLNATITNVSEAELCRGVEFLIKNSKRLLAEGVMPDENGNGIVDFKVYDNPKRIGSRRNLTFTNFLTRADHKILFMDATESNEDALAYIDRRIHPSLYLKEEGNPLNKYKQEVEPPKEEEDAIPPVEPPVEEDNVPEVSDPSQEGTGENGESTDVQEPSLPQEEATEQPNTEEEVPVVNVEKAPEEETVVDTVEAPQYIVGEDGKFYCPYEDCEKHTEGYTAERYIKSHMEKVHGVN